MTADTVGGVWTYALDLSRELEKYGVEVALATMGRKLSHAQAADASAIPNLQIFESTFKLEWMENPWEDIRHAGKWLLSLEDAIRPDVVHLNGYCFSGLRWSAPTVTVCHSCVLSWWKAVKGGEAPEEWSEYGRKVREGLRASDVVVAPTQAMLNCARELYGPFNDSRVIANGRSQTDFAPAEKEPFVFSAGRLWDEAKNVQSLERVASRLSWPVYVAGEAAGNAEKSSVEHLGFLDKSEMKDWLGRASIYALPARYEPFGLSILEAALSRCALVLGDIASLRENWEDCALFIDPDNEAALAEGIERLVRDDELRSRLASNAYERAQSFGSEIFGRRYLDLYKELNGGNSRPNVDRSRLLLI